ncbi:hypothetical protein [Pseudomonas cavernicola]|uniref:hypothetical protein n=1 Tax=Pseudomonas cavernicola TaxID=2320866 RepID=UPI0015AE4F57
MGAEAHPTTLSLTITPGLQPADFFAALPAWMEPITHSGIAMSASWAVLLNLLFNILGEKERAHLSGHAESEAEQGLCQFPEEQQEGKPA